jgi:hypothetical protein
MESVQRPDRSDRQAEDIDRIKMFPRLYEARSFVRPA